MRYFAGTLDPNGDNDQTIKWKIEDVLFDTGQFARFSFNSGGKLVEVHESGNNDRLFYRIGHLNNPAQGDFKLVWDSQNGAGGIQYDNGANPTISVNNNNQIVESHQQRAGRGYVDYRRGTLAQNSIAFATTTGTTYDKDSNHPDVALTNQGVVIETSGTMSGNYSKGIAISRTGLLNSDPTFINWSGSVKLSWPDWPGEEPSVATNDVVAVAIWAGDGKLFTSIAQLPK